MPELILMPYPAFSYIRFVKKERPLVSKSEHKDVLFLDWDALLVSIHTPT